MSRSQAVVTAQTGSASFFAGKNKIINGDFSIWQRGTSIGTGYSYTADRWFAYRAGAYPGMTISRQSTGLTGFRYCARVQRDSGNATDYFLRFQQVFETAASIPLAGQTLTVSFYARAGANYSSASNALSVNLYSGTGTDQNGVDGFATGGVNVINTNVTITTSWQRFTLSGVIPTNSTQVGIALAYVPSGTAGANDYFEVTGVQLETGSAATPFQTATGTLQGELAACQRYYWRASGGGLPLVAINGFAANTTSGAIFIVVPTPMRVAPTAIEYSNMTLIDMSNNSGVTPTNLTISTVSNSNQIGLDFTVASTTAGRMFYLRGNNTGSPYLGLSAEL